MVGESQLVLYVAAPALHAGRALAQHFSAKLGRQPAKLQLPMPEKRGTGWRCYPLAAGVRWRGTSAVWPRSRALTLTLKQQCMCACCCALQGLPLWPLPLVGDGLHRHRADHHAGDPPHKRPAGAGGRRRQWEPGHAWAGEGRGLGREGRGALSRGNTLPPNGASRPCRALDCASLLCMAAACWPCSGGWMAH